MVVEGSVERVKDGLTVRFGVSDGAKEIKISYTGILPDLFSEGQGIVALGSINNQGEFIASEVLAKHDENYMPPEVADAMEKAKYNAKYQSDLQLKDASKTDDNSTQGAY